MCGPISGIFSRMAVDFDKQSKLTAKDITWLKYFD